MFVFIYIYIKHVVFFDIKNLISLHERYVIISPIIKNIIYKYII